MKIINVIKTEKCCGVLDILSFAVHDDQLSDDVVENAEKAFLKVAETLGWNKDEIPEDDLLDDGYFENNNKKVEIVWSYIDE